MFSTQADDCIPIRPIFAIIFSFAAAVEKLQIGISCKGLNPYNFQPLVFSCEPVTALLQFNSNSLFTKICMIKMTKKHKSLPHNPDF